MSPSTTRSSRFHRRSAISRKRTPCPDSGAEHRLLWSAGLTTRLPEHRQIESVRHRLVTRIIGVQMVANVVRGADLLRILRIARSGVKIDHRIVSFAVADPIVEGRTNRLAFVAVISRARERR